LTQLYDINNARHGRCDGEHSKQKDIFSAPKKRKDEREKFGKEKKKLSGGVNSYECFARLQRIVPDCIQHVSLQGLRLPPQHSRHFQLLVWGMKFPNTKLQWRQV
jgi:hypothetical protein